MPVHGHTKTTVMLFTWDPRQEQDDPNGGAPNGNRAIQPLNEEWFEGQEGLQFFESNAVLQYYLVNAGRSLIFGATTPPQSPPTALQNLQALVEKIKLEKPAIELAASSSGLRSSSQPEVPDPESPDIDADTTLSSISTSVLEEEHREGDPDPDPDSHPDDNWSDAEDGSTNNISQKGGNKKGLNAVPAKLIIKQVWESPIKLPIPLKLQFEYHRETFQCSINELRQRPRKNLEALNKDPGTHQDICINIFYNGELTHSRIVLYKDALGSRGKDRRVDFSGRRIHRLLEVPWAILQVEKNLPITDSSFEKRWNEVNQMLATEADEWGRAGKTKLFRSPMGEYLEAMSKLPMPEGARKWNERGGRAGIIDLVVTVGRQYTGLASTGVKRLNVVEPTRRLYQGYIGKVRQFHVVPEEERARQQEEKRLDELLKFRRALSGSSAANPSKVDNSRRKAMRSEPIQKAPRPGHMFAANTNHHVDKARAANGTNGTNGFGERNTAHEAADSHEGFGLDGSGSKSKRNTKAQSSAVNPPSRSSAKRKRTVDVPTSRLEDDALPASSFSSETANTNGAGIRRSSRGKSESSGSASVVTVPKTVDESVSKNPRPQKRSKPETENQPASSQVDGYSAPPPSKTTQNSKNSKSKNSAASKQTKKASLEKNVTDLIAPSQDSSTFKENTNLPRDESSTFFKSPAEQHLTQSGPAPKPDKKERAPSRAMSERELSSVLKPHEKSEKVDNSFGSSFLETAASNGPVRRKSNKKQPKGPTPKETQPTATQSPGVTATIQGQIIKFKGRGVNGDETENSRPDVLANSTKAEKPIERAGKITGTAKVSQAKTREAGNTGKPTKSAPSPPVEEAGKSSNRLANIIDNSPMVHDCSSSTSTLTKMPKKVSEAEASKDSDKSAVKPDTTETLPTTYPSIAKPKDKPKPKPNININATLANKRSYSENSQGLKTPTPKTDTFDVRKGTDSTSSTSEPSSHLVMQDAPISSRSTTLQPVVPSLFDSHVSAARTSASQSWGLREQPADPVFTSDPLPPPVAQSPLPAMTQKYRHRKGKGKDSNISLPASKSEDKKRKGKEMAFQSPVLQRGDKGEGNETVAPAPTLKLQNVKGNGTEKVVLTNGEDMQTPDDGKIEVKDFAVVNEYTATPSDRKDKGKEVEISVQKADWEDDNVAVTTAVTPKPWAPNSICRESPLTYGSHSARWEGMKWDYESAHFFRNIPFEREGLFRASGVLFGVRFVVGLGVDEPEPEPVPEIGESGADNPDIDIGSADTDAEGLDIYDA